MFGLVGAVLFLQSMKFASSLWVLLEFGYMEWSEYLLPMLRYLVIWAALTGAIFAVEFFAHSPSNDPKGVLRDVVVGFINGFVFTYLIVLVLAILLYIPLGVISIFAPDIVKFATLAFALLVAAYMVFIWIAIDTPSLLFQVIKRGNWYFRLLAGLGALLLATQILGAIVGALRIILHNSIWRVRFDAFILAVGVSLLTTIVMNVLLIRREALVKVVFAIVIVYIASIVTGNVSDHLFHWGELPSALVAAVGGPVVYTLVAKALIRYGMSAIAHILGLVCGLVIGLLAAHFTKLRITGQGWFGILCGTVIVILLGVGFGLSVGGTITNWLIDRVRIKPVIAFWLGAGLILGIVAGMLFGGFAAR